MTLIAAVVILILLAVFIIPTVPIAVTRVAGPGDFEFASVSSQFVQENRGLQEALSCADYRYEVLTNAAGYSVPVSDVCHMKISWFDFEKLQDTVPLSKSTHRYNMAYSEKYYLITMLYG